MANAIVKAIRKIRRIHKNTQRKEKPWERAAALAKAEALKRESWERDKKNKRTAAFTKARLIRSINIEENRKQKEAEEIRQADTLKARLKNLKKARRAKRRNNG